MLTVLMGMASPGAVAQTQEVTKAQASEQALGRIPELVGRPAGGEAAVDGVFGLPAMFEANVGQAGAQVSHVLRSQTFSAAFRPDGFDVAVFRSDLGRPGDLGAGLLGNLVGISFLGTRGARITPQDRAEGEINILLGTDRQDWYEAVPTYRELVYRGLYEGVDMVLNHDRGALEFALDLRPGAGLETVRFAVEGAERLALTRTGALAIHTSGGVIELSAPKAAQIRSEQLEILPAAFVLLGSREVGFTVEGRARDARLIVDPQVVFQSYFGGDRRDGLAGAPYSRVGPLRPVPDLKVSPDGTEVAISGTTTAFSFPQTGGYGPINGTRNAFAARFEASGGGLSLIYSTVIGGRDDDFATGVAPYPASADGSGERDRAAPDLYLSGWSASTTFPTSPGAIHETRQHGGGFVVLLGATGQFLRGTMIGHGPDAYPNAIALDLHGDPAEHALIMGGAIGFASEIDESVNAPVLTSGGGVFDGFVARIRPELDAYHYLTYVGGGGVDVVQDVAVLDGTAYAVGATRSFDLPTGPGLVKQLTHSGITADASAEVCPPPDTPAPILLHTQFSGPVSCFDGFIARFSRTGEPLFLTYDGIGRGDFLHGVAVDTREDFRGFVAATGSSIGSGEDAFIPGDLPGAPPIAAPFDGAQPSTILLRRATNAGGLFGPNLAIGEWPGQTGEGIALDSAGRAHVVGTVSEPGLSAGAAVQEQPEQEQQPQGPTLGDEDWLPNMFYLQAGPAATQPDIFAYLGGSRADMGFAIDVAGVPLDGFCATLLGQTASADIEGVSTAGQPVLDGATDLLLAVLCEAGIRVVTVDKTFQPGTVYQDEGMSATGMVRFTVTNHGPSAIAVTLFDQIAPGMTFVGGYPGCNWSATRLRCNVTVPGGGTPEFVTVPVRIPPGACPARFENTARLYAGHTPGLGTAEPAGPVLLQTQPTTLEVQCRPRNGCRETDAAGNCLCGVEFGPCTEEGTSCVDRTGDAGTDGALNPTFGICLPEESRDCRIRYGWVGGTELLTIPAGETITIDQNAMRFVRNFQNRPAVFVQMAKEGIVSPEFTLFPGDRDPADVFGDYVPVPPWANLPVLKTLRCLTAW